MIRRLRAPHDASPCPRVRPHTGGGTRDAGAWGAGSRRRRRYRDAIPTAAFVSFRLGGSDGVAVEAAKWARALGVLGYTAVTVAGDGPVDRLLPGLAMAAEEPPSMGDVARALEDADLVIVENLCSLPLNPAAAAVVAAVLAERPAVLHHHDLPWQRPQFADAPPPPDDPAWRHVTINERSRRELASRNIAATTVYNSFDPLESVGDDPSRRRYPDRGPRARALRAALGVSPQTRLVLQPTRALPRKNVAGGMAATGALGGSFWLLGAAEDGFGPTLDRLVAAASCPVLLGHPDVPHQIARRVRSLRRRRAALDLGGLRQPLGRVLDPPTPAPHRPLSGRCRARPVRVPLVLPRPDRPPLRVARRAGSLAPRPQRRRSGGALLDGRPSPAARRSPAQRVSGTGPEVGTRVPLASMDVAVGTGPQATRDPGRRTPEPGSRRLTADARRRQLFDVALTLFAERGYAATTMDDIAEAAGVTKPLVYQHFASKRALYLELMDVFSHEIVTAIVKATSAAGGPRQQVERGFAAYFELMLADERAFHLLYGRDAPDDPELGAALRRIEETIAEAIDPLIDADLEPEHRLLLAHAVVGMAEGASRHWLDGRRPAQGTARDEACEEAAARLATRLADFAWAGLRQVHRS